MLTWAHLELCGTRQSLVQMFLTLGLVIPLLTGNLAGRRETPKTPPTATMPSNHHTPMH